MATEQKDVLAGLNLSKLSVQSPAVRLKELENLILDQVNSSNTNNNINNSSSNGTSSPLFRSMLGGAVIAAGLSAEKFLSVETMLDCLLVLYDECANSSLRREKTVSDFIELMKSVVQSIKQLRLSREDFEVLKVIGRGAFGEVCVVRMHHTSQIYAMKILNKWEMLKRAETACFREERDVLVFGDRRWITNLHYAFQDDINLYLIMDYYCGGDLLTLLSKFEDRLPEDMARFYIAEMVLAIHSIHELKYVHRDIKPDNIVLDASGHVRLADFGSCLRLGPHGTVQSNVAVGTPDYISPEILRAMEDGQGKYGPECDWWSLGVCMYEMLFGETPFYAESLVETYGKIMNHKNSFDFPNDDEEYGVSEQAKDLIRRLICAPEYRLGQNGIEDFKAHPWFEGINWDTIRNGQAPYIPEVSSPTDTSNFDVDDADIKLSDAVPPTTNPAFSGHHLPFVGFTFTKDSSLSDVGKLSRAISSSINQTVIPSTAVGVGGAGTGPLAPLKLEKHGSEEKQRLSPDSTRKLQDEINILTKRNCELESQIKSFERVGAVSLGGGSSDSVDGQVDAKFKEFEKTIRFLRQEKDDLQKEHQDSLDRLKQQDKELKDALEQRKLAMAEYTEVTDKLSDLRQQKQKLSRQVRDKEEELEVTMQKVDTLRSELRKTDKLRREQDARVQDLISELNRERQQRERSEECYRQLQLEARSRSSSELGSSNSLGISSSDSIRLEIDRLEVEYSEKINQQQTRYNIEISALRDQLNEADNHRELLQRELQQAREKLDSSRLESLTDSEETILELRKRHEREKKILLDDNRKLISDLEMISESNRRLTTERLQMESEYEDLRNKRQAFSQWERQISEIIQWVSDEKDARGYLQALATKMTEELEYLKHSAPLNHNASDNKNWRNRRSQKLDKMELLNLQSSLQNEIQAKAAISEELTRTRTDLLAAQKDLLETRQICESIGGELKRKENAIKELQQRLESNEGFLERPSSQMSYLDHFLKESGGVGSGGGGAGSSSTTHTNSTLAINMPPGSSSSAAQHSHRKSSGGSQQHVNSSTSSSSNNLTTNAPSHLSQQHNQSLSSLHQQHLHHQQVQQQPQPTSQSNTQQQQLQSHHTYSNQQLLLQQQQQEQQQQQQQPMHHSNYSMESEDGDVEDNNRGHSLSSSKSNLSDHSLSMHSVMMSHQQDLHPHRAQKPKVHQFLVRTFSSPTKCNHCTSLMVGLTRQGVVCELCGFACHMICCPKVPTQCPVPSDQTKRPLGIDPTRGIGTAYEGYVKVPKLDAVKRGWVRQFVVVCDFKLFLYDISADRSALPSVHVTQVLDMRDPEFTVSGVRESDVIHATKKDVPCIFRITTSLLDGGPSLQTLMLADTESEKAKWVVALSELHRILKRNNLPNTAIFRVREVLDSKVSAIRSALSALIIDPERILLGTEDGLFCLDLDRSQIARIGESKKVYQLWYIAEEQLLVILCGKQRHLRLLPIRALETADVEWIKVAESKNCITACTGVIERGPQPVFCIVLALKRQNTSQIVVYVINRNRSRHHKMCEFTVAYPVQSLQVLSDMRLAVGHQSGFTAYCLQGAAQAMPLVHPENQLNNFLNFSGVDAWRVIEIQSGHGNNVHGEYLLVFQTLAIYVDLQGRKSRDREIMYPAVPKHITYCDGHLLVYSETHLDIFNTQTAEWVQSIGLKRSRPLMNNGSLTLTYLNDSVHVVYLANMHTRELLNLSPCDRDGRLKSKRFSLREPNRTIRTSTDRRSKLISAPTNFNHISHMGPGDGIQKQRLLDLPTTIETADQSGQQRVATMRHAPPPPRAPPRPSMIHPLNEGSNNSLPGAKRTAPARPRDHPPSLPRSPSPLGSMSSLHDVLKVSVADMQSESRQSVASNNSSSVSTPPSPTNDRLSSSYDS
ncbi:serine/threonine-protein kinase MRCK beta isoform X1 [Anopheles aquasalis]|uniref:serine/threonine-protein kinase MRCK beta isoform X1 n=1 Tax=Anopheles aquasalis TaxID=42839 RepID=UPI00215ADC08|nr:serine/threonine-protein kinase MRCK beta isoform X1 [Anopheles aquasalis]XP_050095560.1 serine/threonine-protein kinase MRCK beta isoform X1 [Anopheles aquasalis]XP_050095562.1 serine/threonine-protein kinase MRCK beta isoform X1 [Anopheles aquasalis]XP_050095563.1 serine/threonine-protein kinase MRCK beta isoform X1 [Anopheles aquasalis]XP_050095564.1 serine/threonine-protein kinase MRCK beta isoform X1 [Anopheles aquasalis]XP_050095565.1 serine/threonine-protein kinase MRCK beta isoform 